MNIYQTKKEKKVFQYIFSGKLTKQGVLMTPSLPKFKKQELDETMT